MMMRRTSFGGMKILELGTMLGAKCEVMHFVNKGKPHSHDVREVAISVAGSGTVVIGTDAGGGRAHLDPGEFVVIPAGRKHYMIPDDGTVCWSMLIAYAQPPKMEPEAAKSWQTFMDAGLLWWVNRGLHLFGWAICVEVPDDEPIETATPMAVYPARVGYRGFPREAEENGYEKLSKYLADNAADTHEGVEW